ncbi:kinase-like domain-containing protein [Geopyxis carbonaria]|nr:kinase-like domain-containing protein [Geopyxis carbonaria]
MALLLTLPAAQAILSKALPSPAPTVTSITELPDTYFNTLYLLHLSHAPHTVVLKVSPPLAVRVLRIDAGLSAAEATLLPLLHAHLPALPLPALLLHDSSCTILDTPYTLLSHLPGTPSPPTAATAVAAGKLYRQLSTLPPPPPPHGGFGRAAPGARRHATWRAAFTALLEAVLRDGEDALVFVPYERVRAAVAAHGGVLEDVQVPRFCVLDFEAGAVLVDGGEVTGVVDFERCVWGDPEMARGFRDGGGFEEGWRGGAEKEGQEGGNGEDAEWRRRCRARLYEVFHCVVGIVGAFYYGLNAEREMGERKRLVEVLDELARFEAA